MNVQLVPMFITQICCDTTAIKTCKLGLEITKTPSKFSRLWNGSNAAKGEKFWLIDTIPGGDENLPD